MTTPSKALRECFDGDAVMMEDAPKAGAEEGIQGTVLSKTARI
jgi:hypothetical protein